MGAPEVTTSDVKTNLTHKLLFSTTSFQFPLLIHLNIFHLDVLSLGPTPGPYDAF